MRRQIGIVVPVFNEQERLDFTYFSKIAALPNIVLLFVNDSSTDNSLRLLEEYSATGENISVISSPKNLGKANTVRLGWINLKKDFNCEYFGFLDADAAFCFEDVRDLTEKATRGLDNVSLPPTDSETLEISAYWSSRIALSGRQIHRSRLRFILGRLLASLISVFIKGLPWDTQSGFKLFKNEGAFLSAIEGSFRCKWLFDIELLLRLRKIDHLYSVWEEPLRSWRDVAGSKVSLRGYILILKEFMYLVIFLRLERSSHE